MTTPHLNGWTSARLDDLAREVAEIRKTLEKMQSAELEDLREQVREAKVRRSAQIRAYVIPIICACIPAAILLLSHAS